VVRAEVFEDMEKIVGCKVTPSQVLRHEGYKEPASVRLSRPIERFMPVHSVQPSRPISQRHQLGPFQK